MLCVDESVIGPWVCDKSGGTWVQGRGKAIGWIKDETLVAGVLYEDFNGVNVVCHIAGVGNWATRQYLWTIFDYPFKQLKVNRITVPVADSNEKSKRFVEHLGFEREAILHDAHPDGDLILYKMTADKCRWLGVRHGQG